MWTKTSCISLMVREQMLFEIGKCLAETSQVGT
jgi:hypothetical protein